MKHFIRRSVCALLAVVLSLGLIPGASASSFSDISDINTAQNVEVLQMMGVIDGVGGGSFNPTGTLTRAQFCKMAVEVMGQGDRVPIYKNYTIYPDVKPSHWAAGYINLAARTSTTGSTGGEEGATGSRLISGYSDGMFRPDQTITYGQAITILMRMLGYSDADVGVIWPEGYIDAAMMIDLTRGLQPAGASNITRSQAVQLFVNLLTTKQKDGGPFYERLGTAQEAILLDSNAKDNAGNPMMDTSEGSYYLAGNPGSGMLSGRKGLVILNSNNEAITFIPSSEGTSKEITIAQAEVGTITDSNGVSYTVDSAAKVYQNGESQNYTDAFTFLRTGTMATIYLNSRNRVETVFVATTTSDDAVIVGKDGSTEGFSLLTDRTDYKIVKHGEEVTAKALREFDVATYSSSNNTIYISDNRMTVYYQDAYPSPTAPTRIKATGIQGSGENGYLEVMPCAIPTLSQCKVGQTITLLLTENNKVAGVSTSTAIRGNATGFVDGEGKLELFNGLTIDASAVSNLDKFTGQLVVVSSASKSSLSVRKLSGSHQEQQDRLRPQELRRQDRHSGPGGRHRRRIPLRPGLRGRPVRLRRPGQPGGDRRHHVDQVRQQRRREGPGGVQHQPRPLHRRVDRILLQGRKRPAHHQHVPPHRGEECSHQRMARPEHGVLQRHPLHCGRRTGQLLL